VLCVSVISVLGFTFPSRANYVSEGSLFRKITLQRSPNFQPLVFRMEWHPFSTFCSAGILPAFRSPEAFWGSNARNLNTWGERTRNSRRISTSILKDLNIPGISTYTKIINPEVCSSGRTAHLFSSGRPEVFHLAGRSCCFLPDFQLSTVNSRPLTLNPHPTPAESALLKMKDFKRPEMSTYKKHKSLTVAQSTKLTAARHSLDVAARNSVPSQFAVFLGGQSFSSDINARSLSGL
jgi:hypothetical protein